MEEKNSGLCSMSTFLLVAFGQIVSVTGSALTGFVLGAWVYQQTNSTTQYSLILLFTALPSIFLSPLTGALVDRWDRRKVMIWSDTGAAVTTAILAILAHFEILQIWQIYLLTGISSMLRSFQIPAYMASVSLLVPKKQLGRANGIMQFQNSSRYLISPVLAGFLMEWIGVSGVIAIDLATFLFAVTTLLMVRFPKVETPPARERKPLWREAADGWKYISIRPGFLWLLLLFGLGNYANLMTDTVLPPMLLETNSPAVLGSILSAGGLGMLAGTIVMSLWGGPKRRINGVLVFKTLAGIGVILIGFFQSIPLIAAATFLYYFPFPIVNACDQAIWQSKVPQNMQGRVFAIRRMLAFCMIPLAYVTAGPLSDGVFKPLLSAGGAWTESLGPVFGIGPERGMGLLISLMGLLIVTLTLGTALNPRVRKIEEEVPDVV